MRTRTQLGALGEHEAVAHLIEDGLQVLARNWRCRYGELDVIAADNRCSTVVFVEVKTRTGDGFGGLAESVPPDKVRRLRRLAALWLAQDPRWWSNVRIDVIGVRVYPDNGFHITHLRGVE